MSQVHESPQPKHAWADPPGCHGISWLRGRQVYAHDKDISSRSL